MKYFSAAMLLILVLIVGALGLEHHRELGRQAKARRDAEIVLLEERCRSFRQLEMPDEEKKCWQEVSDKSLGLKE